jgi:hypothetical protein
MLIELLLDNSNTYYTSIEIFDHISKDDPFKDYSADAIRSLMCQANC